MRKIIILFSLLLTACTVGPDYTVPKLDLPGWWHAHVGGNAQKPPEAQDERKEPEAQQAEWWKEFHDTELDQLVRRALDGSPTVKTAVARIAEARGVRRAANAGLFPQVDASASAERLKPGFGDITAPQVSKPVNVEDAGFDASWEIDLFGVTRRRVEAASANIEARQADLHEAQITLIGDVARTYVEWLEYRQMADLTSATAIAQRKLADIAGRKYRAGAGSLFEVTQAETLYKSTLAKVPPLEQQREAAGYQLSLLLGIPAGALNDELKAYTILPKPVAIPALSAPADTIRNRPDVQSAERQLAAATALTGSAIAQMYPQLTLSGMYGVEDTSLSSLTRVWTIAGGLTAPLFDFGLIQGGIDQAKAQQEEAYQQYRQTVLAAVSEIETDLSAVAKSNAQAVASKEAADSAAATLSMAHRRFDKGISALTEVLDAETASYTARAAHMQAQAQLLVDLISLHKALGSNALSD